MASVTGPAPSLARTAEFDDALARQVSNARVADGLLETCEGIVLAAQRGLTYFGHIGEMQVDQVADGLAGMRDITGRRLAALHAKFLLCGPTVRIGLQAKTFRPIHTGATDLDTPISRGESVESGHRP